MNSEQHIVELFVSKHKNVMELLYDRYSPALFGVVLRIVESEELAEDVMQDAFVKIWKNSDNYSSHKGTLFTWMLNIARNTAIDTRRSAHFRRVQSFNKESHGILSARHQTLNINHIGVKDLVNRLDHKYRVIIDLIYFKGYTQKEVTEELEIPLGTVKTRLRFALRELRKSFQVYPLNMIFCLAITFLKMV